MKSKRKKSIYFKRLLLSGMFLMLSFSLVNSAEAVCSDGSGVMNCDSGDCPTWSVGGYPTNVQIGAECVRGRYTFVSQRTCRNSNYSDTCSVGCATPATCGTWCECRCRGEDLYCADVTSSPNSNPPGLSQYCNVSNRDYARCVPVAIINSPGTGDAFTEGERISFLGSGTDPKNDRITRYRWSIRSIGNSNTRIVVDRRNFSRSNLPPGDYYVYLIVWDETNARSDWTRVRITINARPVSTIIEPGPPVIAITEGDLITFLGNSTTTDPQGIVWHWWGRRSTCLPESDFDGTIFYENGSFFPPGIGTYPSPGEVNDDTQSGSFVRATNHARFQPSLPIGTTTIYYQAAVIGNGSGIFSRCDFRDIRVVERASVDLRADGNGGGHNTPANIIVTDPGSLNRSVNLEWTGSGVSCNASNAWSGIGKPGPRSDEDVIVTQSGETFDIKCFNDADYPSGPDEANDQVTVQIQCVGHQEDACSAICGGGVIRSRKLELNSTGNACVWVPDPSSDVPCNIQECGSGWKEVSN